MDRRKFLIRMAALGCSAAASPLVTPVSYAAAPWDNRLVVILLRGAMDGLDVVQPYGDTHLAGHRAGFEIGPGQGAHDLDGFYALHPQLGDLMPLWQAGELAFAHAVSTPYRDKRSHFDGQDLLEAGIGDIALAGAPRDGWLNRMLQSMGGAPAQTAFAVGREDMIILKGDAPTSSWAPDARLDLSPQARLLLDIVYAEDPAFAKSANVAMELAEGLEMGAVLDGDDQMMSMQEMAAAARNTRRASAAKALANFTAERLREEARVASFSIGGWDSHLNQVASLRRALSELQTAILTLKSQLGPIWGKTAVLAVTEFGRTVRENGSRGTDHGTGGAMLMAGGAVRGRQVYGRWPGLGPSDLYQDRDLMPSEDVRAYGAMAMRGLFGLEESVLERVVFPGLDMGGTARIIL